MIAALRLLPVLLRRAPRQAAGAAALCAVGVAVATLVAGTVIAAYAGLGAREDRVVWREPTPTRDSFDSPALQRRSLDMIGERQIDRVDLAAVQAGDAALAAVPVPPGLDAVPAPGTAYVSPALAELIAETPAGELGDRFGRVVGTISPDGLARPDELVAVVGATAEQLGPVDEQRVGMGPEDRMTGSPSAVTPIAYYDTAQQDPDLQMYREMALVAVVLVSVPALMLVGSAARLTAARREQRLAAIRLAGATPGAVRALAAAETALGAAAGAVVGVGASLLLAPALHGVELAGGPWFSGDLRLSLLGTLGLTAGAVLISMAAAVFSLRRVTSQPLGVARAAEPQRARWPRVLGVGVAFGALVLATMSARDGGPALMMIAGLAFVILSLGLVGPWITSLMGRCITLVARRPSTLIAGRRIVDDPKAAYRVVSSVVLAGLIAGFLAGVLPTANSRDDVYRSEDALMTMLDGDAATALEGQVDGLTAQLPGTRFEFEPAWTDSDGQERRTVTMVPGPGVSLDELRTATTSVRGGVPLIASFDDLWNETVLMDDVRRGSLVILIAGLVLAAASSAVAAAASVVDQRRTIARLALTGVPVGLLQRARRLQATVPLVAATTGAVGLGLGSAYALMIGFGAQSGQIASPEVLQLVAVVVGAVLIGLASAAVTRPLLVNAARSGTSSTPS